MIASRNTILIILFSASYDKYLSLIDVQHVFELPVLPDIFIPVKTLLKLNMRSLMIHTIMFHAPGR